MPPCKAVQPPGEPFGMNQIHEALTGMIEVLHQQIEANVPKRQQVGPFFPHWRSFLRSNPYSLKEDLIH